MLFNTKINIKCSTECNIPTAYYIIWWYSLFAELRPLWTWNLRLDSVQEALGLCGVTARMPITQAGSHECRSRRTRVNLKSWRTESGSSGSYWAGTLAAGRVPRFRVRKSAGLMRHGITLAYIKLLNLRVAPLAHPRLVELQVEVQVTWSSGSAGTCQCQWISFWSSRCSHEQCTVTASRLSQSSENFARPFLRLVKLIPLWPWKRPQRRLSAELWVHDKVGHSKQRLGQII